MTQSIRFGIQPTKLVEEGASTAYESILLSQEYLSSTDKEEVINSNIWLELPICTECKLVIFEADSPVTIKEGSTGTERPDTSFLLEKKTYTESFYVKAQDTVDVNISFKTYGKES